MTVRAAPASGRCTTRGPGVQPAVRRGLYVNSETVARLSAARTFGSVKNTGGSSHWNGFIGGYNVTARALPASSAFNWDQGMARLAGAAVPRAQTLNGSSIPYWQPCDSGRLPEYYVGVEPAAAAAWPLHGGGRLQRAARPSPDHEPPEPQSGRPRDLLRVRPAMRSRGAINLMNSRMDSTLARQANIPYPYPSFPGSQSVRQALRPYPQYLDINTGADGDAADDRAITRWCSRARSGTSRV